MTVEEAVSNLAAAGLTTTDYDTWYDEEGKRFNFPLEIPFPKDNTNQLKLEL